LQIGTKHAALDIKLSISSIRLSIKRKLKRNDACFFGYIIFFYNEAQAIVKIKIISVSWFTQLSGLNTWNYLHT
jgi:hypothetical protein